MLPKLPEHDGIVEIAVIDGSDDRMLSVHLRYPGGALANVSASTGLMLSLHNWGGCGFVGAPNPDILVEDFDVVAVGVDYLQSNDRHGDPVNTIPYDFGYIQAMDALRSLHDVYQSLRTVRHPFDDRRIYGSGGSGGGHVIEMANKFAPHTFACIVDLSGPGSLCDDIAYGLSATGLNARYHREPSSPAYLAKGMQEIRDLGYPHHLALMYQEACQCTIVMIHGEDDRFCLADDKRRAADAMRAAGLDVDAHFITGADVDGTLILDSGHGVGDRGRLLRHFAGAYLTPGSAQLCRLDGPSDFERKGCVRYPSSDSCHVISYETGHPRLFCEAST